jgi:oligosaccharide repeat unit polymerase
MRIDEFFILLYNNIGVYCISLAITSILLYVFLIRKIFISWIDPITLTIISTLFANAIPLFLFLMGEISIRYFGYFVLAETLFWGGFYNSRKITFKNRIKLINEERLAGLLYLLFFSFLVTFTLITYKIRGIPALMESRLTVYTGSGGLGILGRLNGFYTTYCVFYSYYLYDNSRTLFKKSIGLFVCTVILIFCILSGSRSSIVIVFAGTYFGYKYFYKKEVPNKRLVIRLLIIGIAGALIVFSFTVDNASFTNNLNAFFVRMVANGDGYWMAYPSEAIEKVDVTPWTTQLFGGLLGPMRLIDYSSLKPAIGLQLQEIIYPNFLAVTGPNARPVLMGYAMFGWAGLIFSYIVGVGTSILVYGVRKVFANGLITVILSFYIYQASLSFIGDPGLGMTHIFDIILCICFTFVSLFVIYMIVHVFSFK